MKYDLVKNMMVDEESQEVNIQFLIDDEYEAIDGYTKVIEKTSVPQLIELLKHIRDEEVEHVKKLKNALNGKFEI